MKKIFTLIAMTTMVIGANAQTEWRPDESTTAANTTIIDDELMKVNTVFEAKCGKTEKDGEPDPVTINDKSFNTYMQIRVNAAPSTDAPTGTVQDGSTPLVIEVKKDVDFTIYYRRQAASEAYNENDGKDMKIVDQEKPATAIAAADFKAYDIDGSYANAVKVFKLEAGKTYTLWAKGTTGRLYGIDYQSGEGGQGGTTQLADGTYILSFDGMSDNNKLEYANGITLQITGNVDKKISGAKSIPVDDKKYTSMKVSNGAQNTLTLPEGKITKKVTFYSYVNKDAQTERDSYWKEVAGVEYDAETSGGIFASYQNYDNPDKREYTFPAANAVTFTNTGEQCCYVIVVEVETGSPAEQTSISNIVTEKALNGAIYNLAGQKVNVNYNGVVIVNGKKMLQK